MAGYYLRAVAKDSLDVNGNQVVALSVCQEGTSLPIGTIHCVSGRPDHQVFRKGGTDEKPDSLEPAPEGIYTIGAVEFAGDDQDYSRYWRDAIGPVWIGINPKFNTMRSDFGIHLDGDRASGGAGTKGCIAVTSMNDLRKLVDWFRDYDLEGKDLVIDWPNFGKPD